MLSLMLNEVAPPPPPPPPPESASGATPAPPPKFLTYLIPSISRPFRRHRRISSSPDNDVPASGDVPSLSNSPVDSAPSSPVSPPSPSSWDSQVKHGLHAAPSAAAQPDVPRLARIEPETIRCSTCGTDFAFYSQIVSKGFTGRYGRAYLVSAPDAPSEKSAAAAPSLTNIKIGKPESRILATGAHVVSDIQCITCRARVGWKYVDAKEESQKYKIGKFILETQRTVDYRHWDDALAGEMLELGFEPEKPQEGSDAEPIVFDSDDSDECDELFAGVWDARTAAKRRKLKRSRR
ncbi:yippee-domain-containing protein [Nemania sp. NC0429]|nr:yippee-domain-containing protein [Nemania sp. NC0429]